uniref:Uncharacterized protein n=1 Tax=Schizaphis graminum TaxID=13262 RepID=A0A2S2ND92_SCHGA
MPPGHVINVYIISLSSPLYISLFSLSPSLYLSTFLSLFTIVCALANVTLVRVSIRQNAVCMVCYTCGYDALREKNTKKNILIIYTTESPSYYAIYAVCKRTNDCGFI